MSSPFFCLVDNSSVDCYYLDRLLTAFDNVELHAKILTYLKKHGE